MTKAKRTSLNAVLGDQDAPAEPGQSETAEQPEEGASGEIIHVDATSSGLRKRTKPGIKQHTAYLPLAVHEQLRKLAFDENVKIHSYLMEGLDKVFADRGLPSIAELTEPKENDG